MLELEKRLEQYLNPSDVHNIIKGIDNNRTLTLEQKIKTIRCIADAYDHQLNELKKLQRNLVK
jgi:hypothetical protein